MARIPFMEIPLEKVGKADVYIDNTVIISLHSILNDPKASAAVPDVVIQFVGHPLLPNEPILREDMLCLWKLLVEDRLEEIKNTLGWDIDVQNFCLKLPTYKFRAWSHSMKTMLKAGVTSFSPLETLLGRLTHMSVIMLNILHFMGRVWQLCISASKWRSVKLSLVHTEDITLLHEFMSKAHTGIDINLITFWTPTHAYFSDACPSGIGGYNDRGKAWQWSIPHHLRHSASINMTSGAGWLRKSNFADKGDHPYFLHAKLQAACSHVARFIKHNIWKYSQWFPCKDNIIADSLSRNFHLLTAALTSLNHSFLPQQSCQLFITATLPQKIVCWLCAWLQQLPVNRQPHKAHQQSNLQYGQDGKNSYSPLIFPTTLTYNPFTPQTDVCHPLCIRSRHKHRLIL